MPKKSKPSSAPSFSVYFNDANEWKEILSNQIQTINSLAPQFGIIGSVELEAAEIRVVWKKGRNVSFDRFPQAAVLAETEIEIFTPEDWTETIQNEQKIFAFRSRKFGNSTHLQSLSPQVNLVGNGWREIQEVTVIGKDLKTSQTVAYRPFEKFYTKEHLEIPQNLLKIPNSITCENIM